MVERQLTTNFKSYYPQNTKASLLSGYYVFPPMFL
jgi:hypothetical protein